MLRRTCVLPSIALALCLLAASGALNAAQRTFVSTAGNDGNPCSPVAPCRGFAKAITVVGVGGEVVVLDSGGYGSVTVKVSASGNTASVFVRESAITRNGIGLSQTGAGHLTASGANLLVANSTAQNGGINVNAAACLDQV